MREPEISVIMSVYNTPPAFLEASISSILSQSFEDFEFIVVDDASSDDDVKRVLDVYAVKDARLKVLRNRENLGLTRSLNRALQIARGRYVARQDSDDVSLPDRLEKQVLFMRHRPDIVLLGTRGYIIDEDDRIIGRWEPALVPSLIRKKLLRGNQFLHTSVMFRRKTVLELGGYDESFRYSQDYDLWIRLLRRHNAANLPDYLVKHRINRESVAFKRERQQEMNLLRIWIKNVRRGNMPPETAVYFSRILVRYLVPMEARTFLRRTLFRGRSYRAPPVYPVADDLETIPP